MKIQGPSKPLYAIAHVQKGLFSGMRSGVVQWSPRPTEGYAAIPAEFFLSEHDARRFLAILNFHQSEGVWIAIYAKDSLGVLRPVDRLSLRLSEVAESANVLPI